MRKRSVLLAEEAQEETLAGALVQGVCRLQHATNMGAWPKMQRSTVNGTEPGAKEWLDALLLRYGPEPPDLPH